MTLTPTFAIPPTFLGAAFEPATARFWVAGVPLDIGTTNRAGARAGPLAVRHASRMLVDGDNPANWRDPRTLGLADVGDFTLALGDIPASLALIEQQAAGFVKRHRKLTRWRHRKLTPPLDSVIQWTRPVPA
ncbi:MAG: arginase family protein [Candidatus Contendobacter sp.]|nr:arginase family protein [Candidatus Contendobacter sp.]